MPDYSKSIIYKLCCKDPSITDIYIGSTTNFIERKCSHKNCCINKNSKKYNMNVYKFIREHGDWDNWDMVQIEIYGVEKKRDLQTATTNSNSLSVFYLQFPPKTVSRPTDNQMSLSLYNLNYLGYNIPLYDTDSSGNLLTDCTPWNINLKFTKPRRLNTLKKCVAE